MKLVLDASVAVAAARPNERSHTPSRVRISPGSEYRPPQVGDQSLAQRCARIEG
jgi:hypothetical protein